MKKRAIILAGGKGTRLRPYTWVLPKPLMPIGEMPILEVIIKQLASHSFSHITLSVNHQSEIIKAFFKNGEKWGVRIDYSQEDNPAGTMGPLKLIKDLPEDFLIMNGDVLTDLNYTNFYESHILNKNIFTVCSHKRSHIIDYGVLEVAESGKIENIREKPTSYFEVSMGIYMANVKILDSIPENTYFGADQLILNLIGQQNPPLVINHKGYWLDIGRPDDYQTAIEKFEQEQSVFLNQTIQS